MERKCVLCTVGDISIHLGDNVVAIKLGIFLRIVELQAKSFTFQMKMHNQENGCYTCDEPGRIARQG